MKRILVTGAGGYVGARLVKHLSVLPDLQLGVLVRRDLSFGDHVDVYCLSDVTDTKTLIAAMVGVDTIVHLAAPNEAVVAQDPRSNYLSTVALTWTVLEHAARAAVRRIVYLSTVHVYGRSMNHGGILSEASTIAQPTSVYAASRLASEHLLGAHTAAGGIDVVIFRLTNVVGAPDALTKPRWNLVGNDLCRQAAMGGPLVLRSSGLQWRDFVALDGVCSVIAAAVQGGTSVPPGTYNLGVGCSMTVRGLAEIVADVAVEEVGVRPKILAPPHAGELPQEYTVDVTALERCGIRPPADLRPAIRETILACLKLDRNSYDT